MVDIEVGQGRLEGRIEDLDHPDIVIGGVVRLGVIEEVDLRESREVKVKKGGIGLQQNQVKREVFHQKKFQEVSHQRLQ